MEKIGNKKGWMRKFFKITVIFLVLIGLVSCGGSPTPIIPRRSVIAPEKNELVDLYWTYKDELNEVAQIVLTSEALRQRIIDGSRNFRQISSDFVREDFSEEEWEKIVDLFEKIRPSVITRTYYGEGNNVIHVSFSTRRVGEYVFSVFLFYFEQPGRVAGYRRFEEFWTGPIEHLDGNWYISERVRERDR